MSVVFSMIIYQFDTGCVPGLPGRGRGSSWSRAVKVVMIYGASSASCAAREQWRARGPDKNKETWETVEPEKPNTGRARAVSMSDCVGPDNDVLDTLWIQNIRLADRQQFRPLRHNLRLIALDRPRCHDNLLKYRRQHH